jgi:hypothetical protein
VQGRRLGETFQTVSLGSTLAIWEGKRQRYAPPPMHERSALIEVPTPSTDHDKHGGVSGPLSAHIFSEKNKPSKNICTIFSLGRLFYGLERETDTQKVLRDAL